MSFAEILQELPSLSPEERNILIERAMELDDFTPEEIALIESRMEAHRRAPETAIPWDEMASRWRERYGV